MEMRAMDDVEMGRDLTPPLPPLSHALHDSFLHSHCSACFSTLLSPPPPASPPRLLYCSDPCSASESSFHASSAELLLHSTSDEGDTSDLRAALRLLAALGNTPWGGRSQRIAGLLTNRDKLMATETADGEILAKIHSAAKAMAAARKSQNRYSEISQDMNSTILEEAAICTVLTNAVEVQDSEGRAIGIAIYDTDFSWINHSCSPNACYRFQFSSAPCATSVQSQSKSRMWISPSNCGDELHMENGAFGCSGLGKGYSEFGPRITVRSIKPIKKGMEVTVAYTDLLQPKAVRQTELLSKYQFTCHCTRCSAEPPTYVDQVLQNFHAADRDLPVEPDGISFNQDEAIERLADLIEDVTVDYLSDGDAESCCWKLEKLLKVRVLEDLGPNEESGRVARRNHCLQLHPLHYLSMKAHTVIASAYKVRGSLSSTERDIGTREASDLTRTGAAYSLLLAGSVHHLFCFESSFVGSAANFWASAGESLLNLVSLVPNCASAKNNKTCTCSLVGNRPEGYAHLQYASYADFQRISDVFLQCISKFTREIWDFLRCGCPYLLGIRDPINFSWLGDDSGSYLGTVRRVSQCELLEWTAERRTVVFQLGIHCAAFGKFLSTICYGECSHLTSHINAFLQNYEGL